ncbi:MAG: GTP-binding protein, partial [Clostridia bacterium]|nr:GTP-binding protein [Clostridia bacterium]MBN2884303.1 GTP-binding protein [Clostridia bacterium]
MKKPLPVILVTGFLGAGKTTFVNGLLSHLRNSGKSVALLINEFGLVSIDSELLEEKAARIYEVNQGSIFCVCTRDQFLKALDGIANNFPAYDIAVIESTGLANTRDIGEYLGMEPFNSQISIRQNFCIVDAANFHKIYETLPASRTQVAEASICIVNKTDLVEDDYLPVLDAKLLSLNPEAGLVHTNHANVDFSELLDLSGTWHAHTALDETPPENITSLTLRTKSVCSRAMMEAFFVKLSGTLLRAKGFITLEDGPAYIEIVGSDLLITPDLKPSEKQGTLVLIGYSLDADNIKKEFRKCALPDA